MFRQKLYGSAEFFILLACAVVLLGHIPKANAQIIWLDQRYWIVRDRGPDEMVKDLSPQVQVALPGHYRLLGNILYNSGNQQLNESFFMLIRDESGQVIYPLDSNTAPAPYKVVKDDSVDGKHRVWRDAGLFYLPSSSEKYTIEFHHYAEIWDDLPYFLNEQHYEGERNAESLNVDAIQLNYEPVVNGAVTLQAIGARSENLGDHALVTVSPDENFSYDITIRNLEQDLLHQGQLVAYVPDSVNIADLSLLPSKVEGRIITWNLPDIAAMDSMHITFTAAAAGDFVPGYSPLIQTVELILAGDIDLSNNVATNTVLVFVEPWPVSPTADLQVSVQAKTDSFQIVNGDTIKYVRPGETYELVLTLENIDADAATNIFLYNQPPPFVSIDNYNIPPDGQAQGYSKWHFPSLAPGEQVSITVSATVDTSLTVDKIPLEDVLLAFSENDDDLSNNAAAATVFLAYRPSVPQSKNVDLELSFTVHTDKTTIIDGGVEQAIQPGDSARYSLVLRNNSPREAVNVRTWVHVPDSALFANFSLSPEFLAFEKHFWFIDKLAPFEEQEISFRGAAVDSLPFLPFPLPSTAGIYSAMDSTFDNNRDSTLVFVTTDVTPDMVDLSVRQTSITDSTILFEGEEVKFAAPGQSYRIDITITNNSAFEAKNVRLLDLFPDSVAAANFSIAPMTVASDSATWLWSTLPANEQRVVSFTATVFDSMPTGAHWLINRVFLSADNEDPDALTDNVSMDSVLTRVKEPPPALVDVAVTQEAMTDSTVVIDGDTINFVARGASYQISITIKNNNPVDDARNVRLLDMFPDSVITSDFSLAPATTSRDTATWLFDVLPANDQRIITFMATVSDSMPIGERWLVNKVMISAENEDPADLANNTSIDSVLNIVKEPPAKLVDLIVSQKAVTDSIIIINGDSINFVAKGETYKIDIMLENLSETPAENVRLLDFLPDSVSVTGFSIEPQNFSADSVEWMFDAVPAKGQLLISLDVRASDFLPIGERWLINRVMASADNEGESNLENNVSVDSVLNRVEPPLPGTVDLQVTQIAVTDSIVVEDGVEFPYVKRDEIFKIHITVKNKSTNTAEDILLSEELSDLGVVLGVDPSADKIFTDSLQWFIPAIDPLAQVTVTLDVQLKDDMPPGRHTLQYRALISAANEDSASHSDNVSLLTVINEFVPPPVNASIRSIPPVVDVGDSIHVEVRVDGAVASYDIRAYLADGSIDSTFADNFIAAHPLTPDEWLSVTRGFTIEHLRSDAREEPIIFELRAVDIAGALVTAQTTTMVISSNYLVLDKNIFKSEEEDFLGIRFKLSYRRLATLDIYDLNGRHITQVAQDIFDGGWTTHYWNGLTLEGQKVGSGVYLVTLRSGEFNAYKKFILVR